MHSEEKRTELGEIGEFGLIDRIRAGTTLFHKETLKGIGDDAAVIGDGNEAVLFSKDMLVEGVHFDLGYTPLRHLGYKAVAVNVSDIAAMNGRATHIAVGIALSNRFSVEAVEELYKGILLACEKYKVDLAGGDTVSSRSGLIISVSVLGKAEKNKVVYRNTARVNDLVCVTGDVGGAYMGLQVLEREKQVFLANPEMQPELQDKEYIIQRQLRPEARMDVIESLKSLDVLPTAMIDISDGLASEILHICKDSGVGASLYEEKLPVDKLTYETAREFNIDPLTVMLNGGEDYELLFTIRQEDFEKVRNHPDITVIGHIQEASAGVNIITKAGNSFPVKAQGFSHF